MSIDENSPVSPVQTEPAPVTRKRSKGRALLVWLVLLAIIAAAAMFLYLKSLRPTKEADASITIKSGETTAGIANDLKAKKLIRSTLTFRMYVRVKGLGPKFQSGRYVISGKLSTSEIANSLAAGDTRTSQFTIKEGLTQAAIANQLSRLGVVDRQKFADLKAKDYPQYEFLKSLPDDAALEGFLFPETYSIPPEGTSTEDVATIMLNQFEKVLTPDLQEQIRASGRSLYDTIIIASIVEDEVKSDKDRRVVAGILYRRLREDIRLDADATLRYGIDKPTEALTKADLASDNPYNTRKRKGLPPGPISNPSLEAIKAAINPEDSEFLFYFTAKDGHTVFSKTNEEHDANRQKFQ
jgi:peptidoglycan lytic transglycosylase G